MTNEPNSPLLQDAHAVQREARALMALRDKVGITSEAFEDRMMAWVMQRRKLAGTKITSPMEGLILAHTMHQCSRAIPGCMNADEETSLLVLAAELLAAGSSLIAYFEANTGLSRADLGLHDDYLGPVRN